MKHERYGKIFGCGPIGAAISIALLFIFIRLAGSFDQPLLIGNPNILNGIAMLLVVFGAGLHLWSFLTLRAWWNENQLCTHGPFKYFRHPMYAAWITFISLGVALHLNSWLYIFWYILLHIIWPNLVSREEKVMMGIFGKDYLEYSSHTGRFLPHISLGL